MKQKYAAIVLLILFTIVLVSCSSSVNNSFTFKNLAQGAVHVNFRGSEITVPVGKDVVVKDIPQGEYGYSTTWEIPYYATSSSASGELSGTVTIKAGTKILLIYSSSFDSTSYNIGATISSSDDQNPPTLTGP